MSKPVVSRKIFNICTFEFLQSITGNHKSLISNSYGILIIFIVEMALDLNLKAVKHFLMFYCADVISRCPGISVAELVL